jgi:hypothetical protein
MNRATVLQSNSRLLTDALGLQLRCAHLAAKPERYATGDSGLDMSYMV